MAGALSGRAGSLRGARQTLGFRPTPQTRMIPQRICYMSLHSRFFYQMNLHLHINKALFFSVRHLSLLPEVEWLYCTFKKALKQCVEASTQYNIPSCQDICSNVHVESKNCFRVGKCTWKSGQRIREESDVWITDQTSYSSSTRWTSTLLLPFSSLN